MKTSSAAGYGRENSDPITMGQRLISSGMSTVEEYDLRGIERNPHFGKDARYGCPLFNLNFAVIAGAGSRKKLR